jgi:hypothetical protein
MYFPNGLYVHIRWLNDFVASCYFLFIGFRYSSSPPEPVLFARYFQCFMLKEIRKKSETDSVEAEKAIE